MEIKTNKDIVAGLLKKMKLPVMVEQYEIQINDPRYQLLSFEERLLSLVEM